MVSVLFLIFVRPLASFFGGKKIKNETRLGVSFLLFRNNLNWTASSKFLINLKSIF